MDANLPPPSGKGKKGKAAPKEEELVDPAKKAEAAIAALLEQARTAARAMAAAEQAAAPAAASEGDSEEAAATAATATAAARAPREVVGLEAQAAAEAARAAARAAAKPKAAAPARHIEPVAEPEDKFELPEVLRVKEVGAEDECAIGGGCRQAGQAAGGRRVQPRPAEKPPCSSRHPEASARASVCQRCEYNWLVC